MSIFIRGARALTLANGPMQPRGRRGASMRDLAVIPHADALIRGGVIVAIEPSGDIRPPADARVIEAKGRVLMPGFIDAHTHACWAGDRLDEWQRKLAGEPYLDILKAGGGIMSTVRAVRAASQWDLQANLCTRLGAMLREGTTTVEVKSGYGLTTRDELKMLRAIVGAGAPRGAAPQPPPPPPSGAAPTASWRRPVQPATTASAPAAQGGLVTPPTVVPTALLGHAIDAEQPADSFGAGREGFIARTIGQTLDAVAKEFGAAPGAPGASGALLAVDAYCEDGAWSFEECIRLFERALALGLPIRVHADQFHSLGMVRWASEQRNRVLSADHLEATSESDLRLLASSGVMAVALPCAGWHTDGRFMNARAFVDAPGSAPGGGGALVLATNCNPGSAPCSSMPFAIALAVRHLKLTPAEAITACTANAAALLGFTDRGVLAPGKRADVILLRHTDERALAYEFGGNPVDLVVCGGEIVAEQR